MAEKYLDQSGVIRLLSGVNDFVNTARKSVSTKMFTSDSFTNVELEPNSITRVDSVVTSSITVTLKPPTKLYSEYNLTFVATPAFEFVSNDCIIWEKELVLTDMEFVKIIFKTYDGGVTYYASYNAYSADDYKIYYTSTDGNTINPNTTSTILYNGVNTASRSANTYTHVLWVDSKITNLSGWFSSASTLLDIKIPDSVTTVSKSNFISTALYTNALDGLFYVDKWVCGYKGTMPEDYEAVLRPFTRGIGELAFFRSTIKSISIPNTVRFIDYGAFRFCENLTSITIPNSVISIGDSAFRDSNISSANIGHGIMFLGAYVFTNTPLYENCTEDMFYVSNYCFGYSYGNTPSHNHNLNIKEGTEGIASHAFSNAKIMHLSIPDSVRFIDSQAFSYTNLLTVSLGSGIKRIGDRCFSSCLGLLSITCNALKAPYIGNNMFTLNGTKLYYPKTSNYTTWLKKYPYFLIDGNMCDKVDSCGSAVSCLYDIPTAGDYNILYSTEGVSKIIIDGSIQSSISTNYTFTKAGLHIIEFQVSNNQTPKFEDVNTILYFNSKLSSIAQYSFSNSTIVAFTSPRSTTIDMGALSNDKLNRIYIPYGHTWSYGQPSFGAYGFGNIKCIICNGTLNGNTLTFYGWAPRKVFHKASTTSLLSNLPNYYGSEILYIPTSFSNLKLTIPNLLYDQTSVTGEWSCDSTGTNALYSTNETYTLEGQKTFTVEANTSGSDIYRTLSYTYQGLTASDTVTHYSENSKGFTHNSSSWRIATEDSEQIHYRSEHNINAKILYIDIYGYETFSIKMRSANSATITASELDSSTIKASATENYLGYTDVVYTDIDKGKHRITITSNSKIGGADVLIQKNQ